MNIPGGWELVVVALLIMVLFGYKKLPEATRSLGKSVRIFKAETKGLRDDDDSDATSSGTTTPTAATTTASVEAPRPTPEAPRLSKEQPAEPHQQP